MKSAEVLARLDQASLEALSKALHSGRLSVPSSAASLARYVDDRLAAPLAGAIKELSNQGMDSRSLAISFGLLAGSRREVRIVADGVSLVWSGPELPGAASRDTAVVVRELFGRARQSVWVSSFSVANREHAKAIFGELAQRHDRERDLQVRLFFDIGRRQDDDRPAKQVVRDYADRFRSHVWPGERLPDLFYDPRSVDRSQSDWSCLHAKCVIIDRRWAFITSANFTEAAQLRNIEAGVTVDSSPFARALVGQFEMLVEHGQLVSAWRA